MGEEDCESSSAHLKDKKMVTEKYPVRHFLGARQVLENGELGGLYRLPGLENPAGGATGVKSDTVPLLCLPESGACHPGILRPMKGVSAYERAGG